MATSFVNKLTSRWANYQPNKASLYKTIFWSVALTLAVGFGAAGWHTKGGAEALASEAYVDLGSKLCADRFLAAENAEKRLTEFRNIQGTHQRKDALAKQSEGWVQLPDNASAELKEDVYMACAKLLKGNHPDESVVAAS